MSKAVDAVKKFAKGVVSAVASDRIVRDSVLAAIAAAVALTAGGDITAEKTAVIAACYGVGRAVVGAVAAYVSGKFA